MLGTNAFPYKYLQCEELTERWVVTPVVTNWKARGIKGQRPFPPLPFGGGCLSNGRFPWEKWDFCSKIKKVVLIGDNFSCF